MDGEEGLAAAEWHDYDALVRDIMLPKLDGLARRRRRRAAGKTTHVLLLTARDTIADPVVGLRPGASDPPETATTTTPGLTMPANSELGDTFKPEDLFPIVDETGAVVRTNVKVQLPAGHFKGGIELKETSLLPDGAERKIYVPGVGEVLARAKGELQRLIVPTFKPAP